MSEFIRTYVERYISGSWSDISSSVVDNIEIEYLISKPDENTKIASVGRLGLVVDNKTGNFSPNANFQRGTKIRLRTVYDGNSQTRFIGTIRNIDPDTLEWGNQFVRVDCVDWMQYAVDYPALLLSLQQNYKVNDAVAYLLSLMSVQPESVTYYAGRETFDFVFDNTRQTTQVYTELSRLALSEFAPIYLKGGNVLVVESANTRNGTRQLTQVPKRNTDLHAILTDPNGGLILTIEGTSFAILADEALTPNLATGTIQPINIEMENGGALTNRVVEKTYPSREDASPVRLFKLDNTISITTFGTYTLRGSYADPNGGAQISGKDFVALVTGTNYVFTDKYDQTIDLSTQLVITTNYGSQSFEHTIFNNGGKGILRKFDIYGIGIYPYNPVSSPVMATGSVNSYSISEMTIDQRYQDDVNAGLRIAESVVDDEKEPRNRLMSVTFDASMSPELMQASQYMDSGDLTWIKNVKPAIDTYAYLRGKKIIITPAGQVTETWYLKEMDNLANGLKMVALRGSSRSGSKNALDFGKSAIHGSGGAHSWTCWIRPSAGIGNSPLISKTDVDFSGNTSNDLLTIGTVDLLMVRRVFDNGGVINAGVWTSATGSLSGIVASWHHVAMTYDDSSPNNDPSLYLDGVFLPVNESATPVGTATDYSTANLIVMNLNTVGSQYTYNYNGYIKDVRIYNRILTQPEIKLMAFDNTNYLTVQDGLVFQAPCVKTEDFISTGAILYPTDRLIDNVYGLRGTPNWNMPSGASYELRYVDASIQ